MSNEEKTVDEVFEEMVAEAKANGTELTESYLANLRSSAEQKKSYVEAYPEAQNIFNNIVNSISEEEAEEIVEILKTGTEAQKMQLAEGLVDLFE